MKSCLPLFGLLIDCYTCGVAPDELPRAYWRWGQVISLNKFALVCLENTYNIFEELLRVVWKDWDHRRGWGWNMELASQVESV